MAKNKPPIQWTQKQIEVAQLLQQGAQNKDVANQLDVAPSLVSKVNKVLKKGFLPPAINDEANELPIHVQAATAPMLIENQLTEHDSAEDEVPVVSGHPPVQYKQTHQSLKPQQSPSEVATYMRLAPVTTTVAFTPIMLNARMIATQEWGWDPNMSWEDFFDTCLFIFWRSMGFMLKAYYKVDKDGNPIDDSDSITKASAPTVTDGNGIKKQEYNEAQLKLGIEIAKYLKQIKIK